MTIAGFIDYWWLLLLLPLFMLLLCLLGCGRRCCGNVRRGSNRFDRPG